MPFGVFLDQCSGSEACLERGFLYRDTMEVFLQESRLLEIVSLDRLYMCGLGELRCRSVGDLGLMDLSLVTNSTSLTVGKLGLAWISLFWNGFWYQRSCPFW